MIPQNLRPPRPPAVPPARLASWPGRLVRAAAAAASVLAGRPRPSAPLTMFAVSAAAERLRAAREELAEVTRQLRRAQAERDEERRMRLDAARRIVDASARAQRAETSLATAKSDLDATLATAHSYLAEERERSLQVRLALATLAGLPPETDAARSIGTIATRLHAAAEQPPSGAS